LKKGGVRRAGLEQQDVQKAIVVVIKKGASGGNYLYEVELSCSSARMFEVYPNTRGNIFK
jgi:hypothetical protein